MENNANYGILLVAVIFIYKRVYTVIKLGLWDVVVDRLTDPEILEQRFPVRLKSFSIRTDSGGNGKHRGGNGTKREIEFLAPMHAAILSGHRRVPPFGLAGGGDGETGRTYLLKAGGKTIELDSADVADMETGDILVVETPGGGGFGEQTDDG